MNASLRLCNLLLLASTYLPLSRPRRRGLGPLARDAALESMRDGLLVVDQHGLIVEHNPAALALAGLPANALGRTLARAVRDRALAEELEAMLRDPGPTCARTVSCRGDEPRCLQITRSLVCDERGRRLGALFTLIDVTRQSRAELAADLANARLLEASRQADRAKSAIFDTINHEFRTPITVILGFAELFENHMLGTATDEQREALAAIHRNGIRLLKLVDDLLDLARLQSGEIELTLQPVEVGLYVAEAASAVETQLRQKQLDLRLEVARDLPLAQADAVWLRRVLMTLLTNAIHVTGAGAIAVRAYAADAPPAWDGRLDAVQAEPSPTGSAAPLIVIEVEDGGPGLSEEQRHAIFEVFHSLGEAQPAGLAGFGSGLGLAIGRRVVEQMAGRLAARSRSGRGSTFAIELRAAERAEAIGDRR